MDMKKIIAGKRDGGKLSREEINFFIDNYTAGNIPDYQMSALLMAIYIRGMDREETYNLTDAMKNSGDIICLDSIEGIKVDKHSSGGVGDKTTLIVAPLASACGVPIAKMSGRGLGFTGGTIDKLESIPGFRTTLKAEEFYDVVNRCGLSVIGQTAKVAPADKAIYALRDATETVANLSLISSSIMSKKLSSGSDAIVLDIKCGRGAFMETVESAEALGRMMVDIGKDDGKETVAVITDMNQPLGCAVGNSLEVIEAIETLKGKGPADITRLSLHLAAIMVVVGKKAETFDEAYAKVKTVLDNGAALGKLAEMIRLQGGNAEVINNYALFGSAEHKTSISAQRSGYVAAIDARAIGMASQKSGAGRTTKEDSIDMAAGIMLLKKTGDAVVQGEEIAVIYGNDEKKVEEAVALAFTAYEYSDTAPPKTELIKETIGIEL